MQKVTFFGRGYCLQFRLTSGVLLIWTKATHLLAKYDSHSTYSGKTSTSAPPLYLSTTHWRCVGRKFARSWHFCYFKRKRGRVTMMNSTLCSTVRIVITTGDEKHDLEFRRCTYANDCSV